MEILLLVITALLVVVFAILHFKQQEEKKAKAKEQVDRETSEYQRRTSASRHSKAGHGNGSM